MPTKRRRHAITETPPVQAALDDLRDALAGERVDVAELVILGAREKLAQLRKGELKRMRLRHRLAERVRTRSLPVDPIAADEVRRTGWVHS
jgi:hypothetical protein